MNDLKEEKTKVSQLAPGFAMACTVIGILAYELVVAPAIFGNPAEKGFNWLRVLGAAVVGGASAGSGFALGKLIEKLRR